LFCVAGILSTFSRGALLGLVTGLAFGLWTLGYLRRKWLAIAAMSVTIGVGAVAIAVEGVAQYLRLGPDLVSTSESRVDAWNATFELIRRHPIVGIGFYEFQDLSGGIEGVAETPEHSHNGFLKAWVEQGPLGACAYLLFVLTFFKTAQKSLSNCSEEGDLKWILGSVAAVGASLFAQELVDANMTIGGSSVAILFATLLSLQVNLLYERGSSPDPGSMPVPG
jgi:O-antigen ligase